MVEELTSDGGEDKIFTVTVDSPGLCKRKLKLEIRDDAVQAEKERIMEKLRKDLEVPGFRKGKVPLSYIRKNYHDAIHADAVQNLLGMVYHEAIHSEGLRPLADPRFDDLQAEDGEGIAVEAHIEVKPEIEVHGYKDVKVEVEKRDVGDSQVDSTLENIRQRMSTFQTVDRTSQPDDYMVIDFAPYLDSGELDEKARQKNYGVSLESENLLKEFREGLMGMKAGEEKEITITYPDDFPDDKLAGTTRTFHVTVTEVKEQLLPALDDAFAKTVAPDIETMDALRARILEDLQKEGETHQKRETQEKIIDKIIEANPFDVPDVMVENYMTSLIDEDRKRRPDVEDEEAREKEIRTMFHDAAIRTVRKYFVLESVVKQEKLEVTEEEMDIKIAAIAGEMHQPVEEVKKMFLNTEHRKNLVSDLLDEKVLNFLQDNADVKVA
jgi:trigger factor